jgi:hypothetical protein
MPKRPNWTLKGLVRVTVLGANDVDQGIRRTGGLSQRNGEGTDHEDDEELDPASKGTKHGPCRAFSSRIVHYTEFGLLPKMP